MISLTLQIQQEIEKSGPMPFHRFMELALYSPDLGYYERQTQIGKSGDFYTSVSVGEVFGQMLAFQFADWLAPFAGQTVQIVETGAHMGRLAGDILRFLQERRPETFAQVEYWIVEPSPTRRKWQEESLQEFVAKIKWADSIESLGAGRICGIIFSNELLDAMPVHRLRWSSQKHQWEQWLVGWNGNEFTWLTGDVAAGLKLPGVPEELAAVLPDGFTTEVVPEAVAWWQKAARVLGQGRLLTFDYGINEEEFLVPERGRGTLRAYHQHRMTDNLLANVGEQDITAHVNFTSIQGAGEALGLHTVAFISQAKFLTQVLEQTLKTPARFEAWTPARIRQFQTLTHPEHLGRAFKVLVQSKKS